MPTFKPIVRNKQTNKQGLSNIKIRVTHNHKADYISTSFYINPNHMSPKGIVKDKCENSEYYNEFLTSEINKYQKQLLKAGTVIKLWSVKQIKQYLETGNIELKDFFEYAESRISFLKENNKATWKVYSDAIHVFKDFAKTKYLPFASIDYKLLEKFENESIDKKRSINTISIYLRAIRAIFNDAIDEFNKEGCEPLILNYPFRKFKIKKEKTRKRNLQVEAIRKIRDYQPKDKYQEFAQDMFMLIFYLIGINTKDLFYYDKIIKGRMDFKRFKGGKDYSIKIEPEALVIINKYKGVNYMLRCAEHFKHHKSFQRQINDKLTEICKDKSMKMEKITTYFARHSWATIARNDLCISKDDISLALGHSDPSKKVTDIYLNEDLSIIDNANRKVIDYLNNKNK